MKRERRGRGKEKIEEKEERESVIQKEEKEENI